MKKKAFIPVVTLSFIILFAGCKKDNSDKSPVYTQRGNLLINNNQSSLNSRVKSTNTTMHIQGIEGSNLKAGQEVPKIDLNKNFVFKLVAEVAAPVYNGKTIQATHVKIIDHYAFVTYNTRGNDYLGGIEIFDVSDIRHPKIIWQAIEDNVDISSVDYRNNKLYVVGATNTDAIPSTLKSRAMLEVISLSSNMDFVKTDTILDLSSYTGTDVKVTDNAIYATSGAPGFLKIYDLKYKLIDSIAQKDARSIDANTNHIYVFNGQPGKVDVYDKTTFHPVATYNTGGAEQSEAKSKMSVSDKYILTALNEGGVKVLNLDGTTKQVIPKPVTPETGLPENFVSNAVSLNNDLVLIANGEAGLYVGGIISSKNDSISILGTIKFEDHASSNFVESKDSIIFVATGLGGLKILTVGIDEGLPPVIIETKVCATLYDSIILKLPENKNNKDANPILFAPATTKLLKLKKESEVFITFVSEGAGWRNTLGYYTYNENNEPASVSDLNKNVIFPNVSQVDEGGSLKRGDMVQLGNGKFPAGTVIGFYLVAQGWQNGLTVDGRYTHYTDSHLNNNGNQQHMLFMEHKCKDIVLTFEDIDQSEKLTYSDNDFNDVIFTISDSKDPSVATVSFDTTGIPVL